MRTLLHCCRYLIGFDSPATQVTEREAAILVRLARDAAVIVEIGTFEGKTAVALAQATSGLVFSIDPFFGGRMGVSYGEVIARVARRRAGAQNLEYIKAFSYDAAPRFNRAVDMIFIDADHSYEGVKRDWLDWTPKLNVGGIVAMHDSRIAPNSPVPLGSMEFFEREVATNPDYELIDGVDALVVLRRLR
jgi:predicted O-methyltransferase YrrM